MTHVRCDVAAVCRRQTEYISKLWSTTTLISACSLLARIGPGVPMAIKGLTIWIPF